MAKYLCLWELDESRIPDDPKKKKAMYLAALGEVKKKLKGDTTLDYGVFLGGTMGYTIKEGTEEEVYADLQHFVPLCRIEVHPVVSAQQAEAITKKMK